MNSSLYSGLFTGVKASLVTSLLCCGGVTLPAQPVPDDPTANSIGMGIGWPNDYSGDRTFADAMRTSRSWFKPDGSWIYLALKDAQGWPTEDAEIVVWADIDQMHGTYRLSFTGQATVTGQLIDHEIKNPQYDSASNTTTMDIVVKSSEKSAFRLSFRNTHGGVKNVKLMRPKAPGSAESYPLDATFTDQFLNALSHFSVIRTMDFTNTNRLNHLPKDWSCVDFETTWSKRAQPNGATFKPPEMGIYKEPSNAPFLETFNYSGVPWEYIILLANESKKDLWIDIPIKVDDDYVRQLALLIKNGNEATGGQGLNPDRKLYIEYSNEVWNFAFPQWRTNYDEAKKEVDRFKYNFDGSTNEEFWAKRRIARRMVDFSQIFRSVFGDDQMLTRIRPILAWQAVDACGGHEGMKYLEDYYLPTVAPGKLISHFIYGGGGSAYYDPGGLKPDANGNYPMVTLEDIWKRGSMDIEVWKNDQIKKNVGVCKAFGIKRIAYEGGPSFDRRTPNQEELDAPDYATRIKPAIDSYNRANEQAVNDPRMKESIIKHHSAWSNMDGDLLTYYVLTHDYQWGFMDDVLDLDTPKMQAIHALNQEKRAPITIGTPVPGSAPAVEYVTYTGYPYTDTSSGIVRFSNGCWANYLFNVPVEGAYNVSANVHQSACTVSFIVDGSKLSEEPITKTNTSTQEHPVRLSQGLHSVRVKTQGDYVHLRSVNVTNAVQTWNIAATAGPGGTITPSGTVSVKPGGNQTFEFHEGAGMVIQQVLVDSAPLSNIAPSYTFQNIQSDHTISVSFASNGESQNLALHRPAYSSSDENSILVPSNCTDGNPATRWSSAFSDPQWVGVDLGSPKTFNQVTLQWENAYGKAYQIQVSDDNQTWKTVYSQDNGQGGVENLIFDPVTARYVQMYGTARRTRWGYSLFEFEVYHK